MYDDEQQNQQQADYLLIDIREEKEREVEGLPELKLRARWGTGRGIRFRTQRLRE